MGTGSERNQTLTILLSTENGYKVSQSTSWKPESFSGNYYTGDFEVRLQGSFVVQKNY